MCVCRKLSTLLLRLHMFFRVNPHLHSTYSVPCQFFGWLAKFLQLCQDKNIQWVSSLRRLKSAHSCWSKVSVTFTTNTRWISDDAVITDWVYLLHQVHDVLKCAFFFRVFLLKVATYFCHDLGLLLIAAVVLLAKARLVVFQPFRILWGWGTFRRGLTDEGVTQMQTLAVISFRDG